MNALVTGANGFTGKYLVKELLSRGINVKAVVRSAKGNDELLSFIGNQTNGNLSIVTGDMQNARILAESLNDVAYVFHTAAVVSFKKSDFKTMYQTNVIGTQTLVNLMLEYNPNAKLIHFSSIATLKKSSEESPTNETHFEKPSPENGYALSKYYSELEVWRGIAEGLNAVIIIPAVIVGYDPSGRSSSNLFKTLSRKLPFVSGGSTGFVDVVDVCRAAVDVALSDIHAERVLLCACNLSYDELYRKIHRFLGDNSTPRIINRRPLIALGLISEIISLIPGISIPLTRQIAKSSFNRNFYDGTKICRTLGFSYSPIEQTIETHLQPFRQ